METNLTFAPLINPTLLAVLGCVLAVGILLALWRGLPAWWLRGFAGLALIAALANPVLQTENQRGLTNIVFVITDLTESQQIADRPEQIAAALEGLRGQIGDLNNFELREVEVRNDAGDQDSGSMVVTALAEAAAEVAPSRLAGAVLITDGRVHDPQMLSRFPAPVHVFQTGRVRDWDRRLVLQKAPAFAIVDEEITLNLRVDTQGAVPTDEQGLANITIAVDGGEPQRFQVRQNTDLTLPLKLAHGGINVLQFNVEASDGELTDRNNSAVISINGVRDRLRVLLVSGEPYSGGRTWRNLLKSDSSVDLVHFTILRSPEKMDGVPVRELSLIAFPTRELFFEKIDEFDLIIFDRYKRRGMLPPAYLENVAEYIRGGGAVLFTTGPNFAGVNSLYRTELQTVLPVTPTTQVIEEGYQPRVSELGERHPVTEGLETFAPNEPSEDGAPGWGRWFRLVDAQAQGGNVVMTGVNDKPLLVLDRVQEGRVAVLLSDHAWLWSRGFEGGGPQLELLRRLAHWMMKEPELEEEQLTAAARGTEVFITRRSLTAEQREITVINPDGTTRTLTPTEVSPGRWQAEFQGAENGLYRLDDGSLNAVVAVGPTAPREFENAIADGTVLQPLVQLTKGGNLPIEKNANPNARIVRDGRVAAGRDWFGVVDKQAFLTLDITQKPLLHAWLWLLLSSLLIVAAWWREGRV